MAADFLSYVLKGEARDAVIDGTIIGYLIAYPRDDDYFIENIAVDPLTAGKGIGKVLMSVVEKSAIEAKKSCNPALYEYTHVGKFFFLSCFRIP